MKKFIILIAITAAILMPASFFAKSKAISAPPVENNISNYDTKEYSWFFKHIEKGKTPLVSEKMNVFQKNYHAYYIGDTTKKILYLTFDEGYEHGYTIPILDVLKKHNVKAAFFVVRPYVKKNPEIVKRMVAEGHLVCNHSARHPSMASILDKDKFNKELLDVEDAYKEVTGLEMPKFFRPPMGRYSELSLKYTSDLGYKTIFWSFAYEDWLVNKQPTHEFAKKKIFGRTHNGAIVLLHAVSKTNSEILDEVLTEWEKEGYEIKPLTDLPN